MTKLKVALCQLAVGANKAANVQNAVQHIRKAAAEGAKLVVLPECFNAPYGPKYFPEYAEGMPEGETFKAMKEVAAECKVWLVAGSIAEKDEKGDLYNTSATFNPDGDLIAKYRKMHLFRINTPALTFDEGETLKAGNEFAICDINGIRTGLGICFDVRYPQLSTYYTEQGCSMLIFPGAFNMVTGPKHWSLVARSRAIDSQQFVIFCSPARDTSADYVAYGHSLVCDPWGNILCEASEAQDILYTEIDTALVAETREALPILKGARHDVYKTVVA
eukprot:TRINITY_DN46865_c0_g1_i1.p1 TRINITY_DN46865_c0_g1~~TRINITY_DN46865_c0_g1_i1.p1  ORF type:complete len:276 (+),score=28.31 TRINITY_DN46865_c0_g1_i1:44-871(+)